MHELIEQLVAAGPVLTDGAWGTQMQARGLKAGECPDAWNLSKAKEVEESLKTLDIAELLAAQLEKGGKD